MDLNTHFCPIPSPAGVRHPLVGGLQRVAGLHSYILHHTYKYQRGSEARDILMPQLCRCFLRSDKAVRLLRSAGLRSTSSLDNVGIVTGQVKRQGDVDTKHEERTSGRIDLHALA
jgi:hypothetical protein